MNNSILTFSTFIICSHHYKSSQCLLFTIDTNIGDNDENTVHSEDMDMKDSDGEEESSERQQAEAAEELLQQEERQREQAEQQRKLDEEVCREHQREQAKQQQDEAHQREQVEQQPQLDEQEQLLRQQHEQAATVEEEQQLRQRERNNALDFDGISMTATTSPNNANLVPGVAASGAACEGPPLNQAQVVAATNAAHIANQTAAAVTLAALIPTVSATVATVNNNHQQLHTASQQAAVASSSEVAGAVANDAVLNAPNVQSTVSTSATVVNTPSQQVAAEVAAWNKNITSVVFSVGNNNGREDAWERSGVTNSTEERVTAERASRHGVVNVGRLKDARVNNHRNIGRDNRDKLVAKKRQDAASPPTTVRRRSLRGSRTITQHPNMWDNIEKGIIDSQTDGEASDESL